MHMLPVRVLGLATTPTRRLWRILGLLLLQQLRKLLKLHGRELLGRRLAAYFSSALDSLTPESLSLIK